MGRKKLNPLQLSDELYADPSEIPDADLDAAQEDFAEYVLEAVQAIRDEGEDTERVVGVLISVVSIDKHGPATSPDTTRYIAGAACIMPPEWEKYEAPIALAGAKCVTSLATGIIERSKSDSEDLELDSPPFVNPDIIHLRDTTIARVEDLFELFAEGPLENIPVMFPAVVADDLWRQARFTTEASMLWPIVQTITETKQMPAISDSLANSMLSAWTDDTSLTLQAMLYANMNPGTLDELDLSDQLFDLCHLVCKQIYDDLETIVLGAPEKLDA
jgi:hypothetical protein